MSQKTDFKNSLNLPQTQFPMKAGLTKLEPELLEHWEKTDLYKKIIARREELKAPVWTLHDGPPYANGHIHTGHALNKILKDIIIKSKTMAGFLSPYVPGWDCHGLPIEHQVDKALGSKKREMSKGDIRRQCRAYAEKFVAIQSEEFQRLGVFGEWDRPYLTMAYDYEAVIARELGRFALSGILFQSPKPVLWCGSCRTALAEAEVEYENHNSHSIYVAFPLKSDPAELDPALAGEKVYLVIWTTTPWTIPSNQGIAYNPEFKYGAWKLADGRVVVLAESLSETALAKFGLAAEKLVTLDNRKLPGLMARHPWYERDSKVVPAMYVTLEQGTGLVHTAPGHGREDYETGLAHNLPLFSPLDDAARYTREVPEWEGQSVMTVNPAVVEHLKAVGALMAVETIDHQYPHCWRCKKPLIFRSTPQWFVSMDKTGLREKALKAIDGVRWVPKWGRDRIYGMIENRPDWCISRQRSWGVPITVFLCRNCGGWHYSQAIMDHLFELFKQKGADAWFDLPVADLLPPGEKCAGCGGADFEKETDILDVWFDSGCSFVDTMEDRSYMPDISDMYLEGSDQHRGWFHSSLLVSINNRDRAPYREVLTHGYVVDGQGRKMSKSLGNTIGPEEVIKKYGADILRLWVAAENYQDDIRISDQILDMLAKAYFNFRNSCRFILGNLFDFDPARDSAEPDSLEEMDRFILHQLGQFTEKVRQAYDDYEFHAIYHLLNNFVVDLSAFYHDVIKDRLYTLAPNDPKRRGTQTVMHQVLSTMVRLMAPILSFTCEEIWGYLPESRDTGGSVFLTDFPVAEKACNNPDLARRWETLLKLRKAANQLLENARRNKIIGSSLDARVCFEAEGRDLDFLKEYQTVLPEILIVSSVRVAKKDPERSLCDDNSTVQALEEIKTPGADNSFTAGVDLLSDDPVLITVYPDKNPKCPRCWVHDPQVPDGQGEVCPKCAKALAERK